MTITPPLAPGENPTSIVPPQPLVHILNEVIWEHRTVDIPLEESAEQVDKMLNALGEDGWEVCGAVTLKSTVRYTFKRLQPVSTARIILQRDFVMSSGAETSRILGK